MRCIYVYIGNGSGKRLLEKFIKEIKECLSDLNV